MDHASFVSIEVPASATDPEAVRSTLQAIAPFVAHATQERQAQGLREIVDRIVESTPIRTLDTRTAALQQRAIEQIFSGTTWLAAEQLGRLRDPAAKNPHSIVSRWRRDGKVYSLTRAGIQYVPRYAFDESLEPLPVIAQILRALGALSPYRVAAWFETTNTHLGARRPRDLLLTEPADVLQAAHAHAETDIGG